MGGVVVEACHPKNEYLHCWNPQEDFCEGWYHQVGAHLCHLGVEKKKKKKSWTELTSQKLLEGSTGKLLWALPGAVRDDADGAPSLQWGGDFWAPCGTSKNWGLAGGMEANFQCCVHGLF